MPSTKVVISPNIITWILKTTSLEGIDDEMRERFSKWKNNEKQPTFNQIEEFSKKTCIPLGYFFLETPPSEQHPLLKFRTIDSTAKTNPSRDLIDTYYHMTAIQDWMREYLIESGNDKLDFIGSCKNEKNIDKTATIIRDAINLDIDWYTKSKNQNDSFNNLRQCFEKIGILIIKSGIVGQNTHRPLDVYEFRAFTLIDDYAPLVFINNKDSESGQLFSILHEIVHIWHGLSSFYNDSHGMSFDIGPLETICNAVAAELLVPKQVFLKKWDNSRNISIEENIEKLTRYFKCGKSVILRKAFDNNLITKDQYLKSVNVIIAAFRSSKNKSTGGDYYNNMVSRYSPRFVLALANSISEGRTLFKEAHKLTNANRITFEKFVNEVREHFNAQ